MSIYDQIMIGKDTTFRTLFYAEKLNTPKDMEYIADMLLSCQLELSRINMTIVLSELLIYNNKRKAKELLLNFGNDSFALDLLRVNIIP